MKPIEDILSDASRSGTTKFFSMEQVVQIVAMACEYPKQSQRPVIQMSILFQEGRHY
ncbi:hypothetical protein ACP6PL_28890 [Dapis sp. BLCC M126]|uniref:hypothetical protein n=1 Tax=Dapis sp. BLCC M126 TaxID=3400189 RepID=UPI003CF127D9